MSTLPSASCCPPPHTLPPPQLTTDDPTPTLTPLPSLVRQPTAPVQSGLELWQRSSSSSYSRILLILLVFSFLTSFLYVLVTRLSCSPTTATAPFPTHAQLITGDHPHLRFIVYTLYFYIPKTQAFAAFILCWAFALKPQRSTSRRPSRAEGGANGEGAADDEECSEEGEEVEEDGDGSNWLDLTRLSGWTRLFRLMRADAKGGARRIGQHFALPPPPSSSSPTSSPSISPYPTSHLSESLLNDPEAPLPPHPLKLHLKSSSSTSSPSSSSPSPSTSMPAYLLTCLLHLTRALLVSPFLFLRWFASPFTPRAIFYRLFLWNFAYITLKTLPVQILVVYGIPDYGLPPMVQPLMTWLGFNTRFVSAVALGGVSESVHRFFQYLFPFVLVLLYFRPSRLQRPHEGGHDKPDISKPEPQDSPSSPSSVATDSPCSTLTSSPVGSLPDSPADGLPSPSPSGKARRRVLPLPPQLRALLARRPSVLGVWFVAFMLLEAAATLWQGWVMVDWTGSQLYEWRLWLNTNRPIIWFCSLVPALIVEELLHCRSAEHRHAFPAPSKLRSPRGGELSTPFPSHACSCYWWRVVMLALLVSWGFYTFTILLGGEYGRVKGDPADQFFASTWLVLRFYLFMGLWKACAMWLALYALPAGSSVACIFPIQLTEDVWSCIFFTSFTPWSYLFWLLCVVHFVKTLLRDLNVPFFLLSTASHQLQQFFSISRRNQPRSLPQLSPGWRGSYDRRVLRHQNFLTFVCAKIIVLASLVVDLLPESIGSYGLTPLIGETDRLWRVLALCWLIGQQLANHALVLALLKWLETVERRKAEEQEGEAASVAAAVVVAPASPRSELAAGQQAEPSPCAVSSPSAGAQWEEKVQAECSHPSPELHITTDLPPSASPTSPFTPSSSFPSFERHHPGVVALLDANWRSHFLFFLLCILRISFETLNSGMGPAHHTTTQSMPDARCVTGW